MGQNVQVIRKEKTYKPYEIQSICFKTYKMKMANS